MVKADGGWGGMDLRLFLRGAHKAEYSIEHEGRFYRITVEPIPTEKAGGEMGCYGD